MGKTMMAKKVCFVLICFFFYFLSGSFFYISRQDIIQSKQTSLTENTIPSLNHRFIKILRKNRLIWLLKMETIDIYFNADSIYFIQKQNSQYVYQAKLFLDSADKSNFRVELVAGHLNYINILHGVDLCFYINDHQKLEYDIVIKKNVDLSSLKFVFYGVDVQMSNGVIKFEAPCFSISEEILNVYNQTTKQKIQYEIHSDSSNSYHYEIPFNQNTQFPIIIDPVVEFSTYIGESEKILIESVTTDETGIHACGTISIPSFFLSEGYHHISDYFQKDSFYLRMNTLGSEIFTFLIFGGETGDELPVDIDLSTNGAVYIGGTTTSSDLPVTSNGIQLSYNGFGDVFCYIINVKTEEIFFASYWGGSKSDNLKALAVQTNGNIVLIGNTNSKDFPLFKPTQRIFNGVFDGFISVLAIDKKQAEFSSYLGGKNFDSAEAVTINKKTGDIIVSGSTLSYDFYTRGKKVNSFKGGYDFFITQYSPSFSISFSSPYGGKFNDFVSDILINKNKIFIVGTTTSTDFPVTTQQEYSGHDISDAFDGGDAFLMVLQDEVIIYARFIGGESDDMGVSVSLDLNDHIIVTGNTRSKDLPVTHNAVRKEFVDIKTETTGMDGFVFTIDANYENISFFSYWGGEMFDRISDSSVYKDKIILAGETLSEDFITTFSSIKIEKTRDPESFISCLIIVYYLPRAPLDVKFEKNENEHTLYWSPSEKGESPVKGYNIYHKINENLLPPITLHGNGLNSYAFPSIDMENNHYFYVTSFDMNDKESYPSNEVGLINNTHDLEKKKNVLLVEYYDSSITEDFNEITFSYFNDFQLNDLGVLHYYPNKNPSQAIKSRKRKYNPSKHFWSILNGIAPLSMKNFDQDQELINSFNQKKLPFNVEWEMLSVPNDELNKKINLIFLKHDSYPAIINEFTIFLTKKIDLNHWEVIQSEKKLWEVPINLFGEDRFKFHYYLSDFANIQEKSSLGDYFFAILIQDPDSKEILNTTFIPLLNEG